MPRRRRQADSFLTRAVIVVGVVAGLGASPAEPAGKPAAVEPVVIRLLDGRFLGVAPDRLLRAHGGLPTGDDEFRLLALPGDRCALATRDSRLLGVDRGLLALSAAPHALAGPMERLKVVAAEGRRVVLEPEPTAGSGPGPTVELYRIREVPATLRSVLSTLVQALVVQELKDREYCKERTRQRQRFLDLPAPRPGDLKHTKRVRVLSTTDKYEIKARLKNVPGLEIGHLPYLSAYCRPGTGVLLFAVRTQLPVSGQVHYEVPKTLSVTTGFQATVGLDARGEVGLEKSADQLKMDPPKLLQLRVTVDRLDISNDLLNTARALIEEAINHELQKNDDRLREKANASIAKGMATREFRNPLLRFLSLP